MCIQDSVAPFESIETLTAAMADHGYFAGHSLAAAIFLSVNMSKPLLLEGEPGVGKTEVAKVLASLVGAPLIRLQCYEGIDVHQAIYQWDFARQMIHIRMLQSEHGIRDISRVIYGEEFLLKGPLLRALESTAEAPAVLLIDEIDRADDEFEALLLEALSDYQVSVPEIGTVSAAFPPIVVITSNRTREVHDALKRRCLYQWIDFPSAAAEQRIVMAKVPDASQLLVMKVTRFVQELRAVDLYKVPGIAETIDWARALVYLGCEDLTREAVLDSIGALLKYQEDMKWSRSKDFAQLMDLVTDA